jgi:cyanophycin synthetase
MQQIVMFSLYTELFRARIRGTWHFFVSLPIPPQRDTVRGWVDDKHILKLHLRVAHVPVPLSDIASTEHHALAIFGKLNVPVVVKPRLGSRGRHTTTNVRDTSSLLKAFHSARLLCPHVSIEEQISGRVCRATVIGGTVRGFFEARAPHVVGDGILSIRALIDEKNLRRPDRVSEIVLTEEIESYLSSSGLSLLSVPKEGEDVMLTHRTGRLFGGETRELLSRVHPKLVQHLERAARAIDMSILGFDLVIEDPERDPDTQKWGIIEANTLPFIDLHYLPLYGTPSRPAEAVWDLWK